MKLIIGFDETGRGNVVGPLVMGMAVMQRGVASATVYRDSKTYSSLRKLTQLATHTVPRDHAIVAHATAIQEAHEIDEASTNGTSLNDQEIDMIVDLLNAFAQDARSVITLKTRHLTGRTADPVQLTDRPECLVVIDQIGPALPSSTNKLLTRIRQRVVDSDYLELSKAAYVMRPRAETAYQAVAVASIVARHELEVRMRRLDRVYACDMGSGAPSDPKVKRWLASVFDYDALAFPRCVRHTWQTCATLGKRLLQERATQPSASRAQVAEEQKVSATRSVISDSAKLTESPVTATADTTTTTEIRSTN